MKTNLNNRKLIDKNYFKECYKTGGTNMSKNVAVITGASSGLGMEFAFQIDLLFTKIDEIWLIARRKERLVELSKLLETKTKVIPMDVANKEDMDRFYALLKQEKPKIRMLINCAGYGLMGKVSDIPIVKQLGMIDVNVRALTNMTYACLPYLTKHTRIIQLASAAAFLPQKNFAVYAAGKSYVLSFSRALAEELRQKHIYVTAVCPGPVATEFFDHADTYGHSLLMKEKTMVTPDRVVKQALHDSHRKKQVSVCSPLMKAFMLATKILPHRLFFFTMRFLK